MREREGACAPRQRFLTELGHLREGNSKHQAGPFVGIDVSTQTLQVCVLPDSVQRCFDNSPSEYLELLPYLASLGPQFVVLEPTEGYELDGGGCFGRVH